MRAKFRYKKGRDITEYKAERRTFETMFRKVLINSKEKFIYDAAMERKNVLPIMATRLH